MAEMGSGVSQISSGYKLIASGLTEALSGFMGGGTGGDDTGDEGNTGGGLGDLTGISSILTNAIKDALLSAYNQAYRDGYTANGGTIDETFSAPSYDAAATATAEYITNNIISNSIIYFHDYFYN